MSEKFNLDQQQNLFEQPQIIEVYNKLYQIRRDGWERRGIKNGETVGEHSDNLVELAENEAKDLSILNLPRLIIALKVHDMPEIIEGDVNIALLYGEEYERAKQKKYQNEYDAMKQICQPLGLEGEMLFEHWLAFEKKEEYDMQIASQLDKIQPVFKAFEYEKRGEKVSTMEFINNIRSKNQVTHPFLIEKLKFYEEQAKLL